MQRGKTLVRAVTAVLLTGAVGLASPAPASAASGYNYNCFGYTGTFMTGTIVEPADWNGDGLGDECFGIAPNRTIWHAWPGSGGWKVMPNNGLADEVTSTYFTQAHHTVKVYVYSNGRHYCSQLTSSWQPWVVC